MIFFALFNTDRVTLEDKLEHFNGKVIKWHVQKRKEVLINRIGKLCNNASLSLRNQNNAIIAAIGMDNFPVLIKAVSHGAYLMRKYRAWSICHFKCLIQV